MKTVFDVLLDDLKPAIEREQLVLEKGAPKDFAEYKHHVGVLLGLRYAVGAINELKQIQERADNE